eukprot:2494205-Rhodomonas_salina.1
MKPAEPPWREGCAVTVSSSSRNRSVMNGTVSFGPSGPQLSTRSWYHRISLVSSRISCRCH